MKVALMIEGQEGVTWPQWVALAQAAEAAQLDALMNIIGELHNTCVAGAGPFAP